ncbi:MAG: sugar ABC transporter permease [Chloroflexota bacterium]|nr:MAG: sugar ABC transporter permease [Bellilinea sp.]
MPPSRRRQNWLPYLLLLPSIVFLIIFFAYPMVEAFLLAFRSNSGGFTLEHFNTMVKDVAFTPAFRTTLILLVLIIPLQFILALTMALLVQAKLKFSGLFLYIYSIPLGISELAAGIVWFAIFTERGYLNTILMGLGILEKPFIFLGYENTAWILFAIVIAEVWRATSIIMVILVAGLQAIPHEFLEAADIFGANLWQKVWRVILPLLKPSLQVALILRTILAFQVFAVAIAIAGRGVTLLAAEAYRWYNSYRNPNVAAAYAVLILVLSIASTALYLWGLRTPEEQSL